MRKHPWRRSAEEVQKPIQKNDSLTFTLPVVEEQQLDDGGRRIGSFRIWLLRDPEFSIQATPGGRFSPGFAACGISTERMITRGLCGDLVLQPGCLTTGLVVDGGAMVGRRNSKLSSGTDCHCGQFLVAVISAANRVVPYDCG
jgi:hypothetical protein